MHSRLILAPVIGAISLFLAAPAQAQERREVAYSDLNLTTEAGRRQLDRRIHSAVRLVCGAKTAAQVESLEIALSRRNCIKDTSARTMAERAKVLEAANMDDGTTRLTELTVRR